MKKKPKKEIKEPSADWQIAMLWHGELVQANKTIGILLPNLKDDVIVDLLSELYDLRQYKNEKENTKQNS